MPEDPQGVEDFTLPELPSEFEPVEDLIARRTAAYALKAKAKAARELIPVKVNIDGPYGILHFGDPHLDDDGTDWPLINHCLGLLHSTPGLFAANVGDTTNNWIGRLARLYGNQGTSAAEAWRMVEWFMGQVRWLYIVGGNYYCLDTRTEALTQRGWLKYNEIREDDKVLSLDPETGIAAWFPILQKIVRSNTENMVTVKARGLDNACNS